MTQLEPEIEQIAAALRPRLPGGGLAAPARREAGPGPGRVRAPRGHRGRADRGVSRRHAHRGREARVRAPARRSRRTCVVPPSSSARSGLGPRPPRRAAGGAPGIPRAGSGRSPSSRRGSAPRPPSGALAGRHAPGSPRSPDRWPPAHPSSTTAEGLGPALLSCRHESRARDPARAEGGNSQAQTLLQSSSAPPHAKNGGPDVRPGLGAPEERGLARPRRRAGRRRRRPPAPRSARRRVPALPGRPPRRRRRRDLVPVEAESGVDRGADRDRAARPRHGAGPRRLPDEGEWHHRVRRDWKAWPATRSERFRTDASTARHFERLLL